MEELKQEQKRLEEKRRIEENRVSEYFSVSGSKSDFLIEKLRFSFQTRFILEKMEEFYECRFWSIAQNCILASVCRVKKVREHFLISHNVSPRKHWQKIIDTIDYVMLSLISS